MYICGCRFCGHHYTDVRFTLSVGSFGYRVVCRSCEGSGPVRMNKQLAVDQWNDVMNTPFVPDPVKEKPRWRVFQLIGGGKK